MPSHTRTLNWWHWPLRISQSRPGRWSLESFRRIQWKSTVQSSQRGTELSGLDNISPFSKCWTLGRHAGDHHGSPFPNKVLCVDTSKHINLHKTLTVNSFLLNRYSSLTVFIWQNLSISASGHRKNMILTYFETISRVEFSQCDIKIFLAKILIS